MNITVTINCDNAAFQPEPECEVARILKELANKLEYGGMGEYSLRDVNGNRVGEVKVKK